MFLLLGCGRRVLRCSDPARSSRSRLTFSSRFCNADVAVAGRAPCWIPNPPLWLQSSAPRQPLPHDNTFHRARRRGCCAIHTSLASSLLTLVRCQDIFDLNNVTRQVEAYGRSVSNYSANEPRTQKTIHLIRDITCLPTSSHRTNSPPSPPPP